MASDLDYCCCCIDLRKGCLIIGYYSLIRKLSEVITCANRISEATRILAEIEGDWTKVYEMLIRSEMVLYALLLVFVLLHIVFFIYLLIGLHKNKRANIKGFLVFASFFVVLNFVIWTTSLCPFNEIVFKMFSERMISSYSLLVIRSYYCKMEDRTNPQQVTRLSQN